MEQGTVFQSNRSQAVRLPKALALPNNVKRVDVVAIGRVRMLTPSDEVWDASFDDPGSSDGSMVER
jgi:antitoxin VapB